VATKLAPLVDVRPAVGGHGGATTEELVLHKSRPAALPDREFEAFA
jgi:hypothetical protein